MLLLLYYLSQSASLSLFSLPLTFMCFPPSLLSWWEHSQRQQSLCCVVMEHSWVEQRWQGKSANCALLRNNIVMLDYPSACWHCPASPWTHNPAEEQPTANGVFLQRAVVCIQCSVISHSLVPIKALHFEVCLPVCFNVIYAVYNHIHWLFLVCLYFKQS